MKLLCIDCGQPEIDHLVLDHEFHYERDDCQVCYGENRGMKGNENIIDGMIVCDYCSSRYFPKNIWTKDWKN